MGPAPATPPSGPARLSVGKSPCGTDAYAQTPDNRPQTGMIRTRRVGARATRPAPDWALRLIPMEPAIPPEMIAATPRPGHVVRVMFADGEVRDVDITPLLSTPAFSPLRDPAVFGQVAVDGEMGTIVRPGGADLDPAVIYAALDLGAEQGADQDSRAQSRSLIASSSRAGSYAPAGPLHTLRRRHSTPPPERCPWPRR
jgi:hypothetical protein